MLIYEQFCDGRTILAFEELPHANAIVRYMECDCWIGGKQALGYPLTAIQESLLYEFRNP